MSDIYILKTVCPKCGLPMRGQSEDDPGKECGNTNCLGRRSARGLVQAILRTCSECGTALVFSMPQESYCPNSECNRHLRSQ